MSQPIEKKRKYFPINELKALGYSQYIINQLVNEGILSKINKKTYENLAFDGEDSDYYVANAYIPDGVICMMSAATYYNLSNYRTDAIDVAIPRKAKVSTLPDWPDIRIHYFTDFRFEKGIVTIENDGNFFKIYDLEKTVCDIVFYREVVGIEETKEILRNYLGMRRKNLNKLIRYSEEMKCSEILKTYLEVLV